MAKHSTTTYTESTNHDIGFLLLAWGTIIA